MTLPDLVAPPTHKVWPLLRSEISRITHRRLLRVLALLLLGGIVVVSVIVFATHRSTAGTTTAELTANRAEQQHFWEQCAARQSPEKVSRHCGPEPANQPLNRFDYGQDKQYRAKEMLPFAVLGAVVAAAGVAFIVGASSGGAEWSSRSMTLQLLWEPRRLRLLVVKWLGLLAVTVILALLAVLLAAALAAATASIRGTWAGDPPGDFSTADGFRQAVILMGVRGLVMVAMAATIGYAIAVLVRNTGASLGVAFVYFVLVENATRLTLMRYGSEPFMLTTNTVSFLLPGGLDVPGRSVSPAGVPPGSDYSDQITVHLSNLRALITMLGYSVVIAVPAAWSFVRRDVG